MGRAQRRKEENRLRRIEEAKAAEQRRAGRRRKLAIGTGALVVVALVGLFLILRAAPDGETSAAPDTTGTTLLDAAEDTAAETLTEDGPPGDGDATGEGTDQSVTTTMPVSDGPSPEPAGSDGEGSGVDAADPVPAGCPALDGSDGPRLDFDGPPPMCIDPAAGYTAVFHTSEGEMRFELTPADTPQTVNNFVTLARWGYYDGTLLFRTDPSIDIIQGGSPRTNSPSDPGPGYTIPDEPPFAPDPDTGRPVGPYRYQPGQLVMARSAGFDSGGAQFFITTGPNAALLDSQGVYVVFGTTDAAGLEVARSIMDLHVATGNMGGAPSRDVVVYSITVE
ncbi:MAG: peptidylprolyl isomerase [Acidimicrobiia bacterium]|nr:peptidylprolyl isomerase [Acidimicrobiia bacterium]MYF83500.1 peptidylprolyl isomerase [Acidimicrobiia bacterium]